MNWNLSYFPYRKKGKNFEKLLVKPAFHATIFVIFVPIDACKLFDTILLLQGIKGELDSKLVKKMFLP